MVAQAESSAPDQWQYHRSVAAIDLYRKAVAGSDFPAIRAETTMKASVNELFSLLTRYNQFTGLIPNVTESRVLQQGDNGQQVYQRLAFPAPVSDRHYIIQSTENIEQPNGKTAHIHWSLDHNAMMSMDRSGVIPRYFSGSWELRTLPGKAGTRAIYTIHVDPGGHLPAWLFSGVQENYVIQVMRVIAENG